VKASTLDRTANPYLQPMRWLAYIFVPLYYRTTCHVRAWGRMPRKRGPTLIVSNHQHEMESPLIVGDLGLRTFSWRYPIFTVSSRRMWEPGFFAERIPWLRVAREANLGRLFSAVGMQPIENELTTRPFASIAYTLMELEGDLAADRVFKPPVLTALPKGVEHLSDLLTARHFAFARSYVRLGDLRDAYKERVMHATREQLDADIAHFEALVRDGATIFLTPEGFYSGDGKMQRLRGILSKLQPLATIYLAAISYDPYVRRRLSICYRVVAAREGIALDTQLKAVRPITASALVCTYLAEHPDASDAGVAQSVREQLAALPPAAFVVPELRARPEAAVHQVLENLRRIGRRHPQFPRTGDMVAYQRNFHAETLDGLASLSSSRA